MATSLNQNMEERGNVKRHVTQLIFRRSFLENLQTGGGKPIQSEVNLICVPYLLFKSLENWKSLMENLKIYISLIVSDIGNSVYLRKILIKHSFHCEQFNRLANFWTIKLGIFERKVEEDATHNSPISIACNRKGSRIHIFLMLI